MGEAKKRGNFNQRKEVAINNKIDKFVSSYFEFDDQITINLRKGYEFLLENIHPSDWTNRRSTIISYLNNRPDKYEKPNSRIRYVPDEIGWYIFLCEEFFKNPSTTEYIQFSRIAPFISCLGSKVELLVKIRNIGDKVKELVKKYKSNPDGLLFEIIIASSYLEQGFNVEFINETGEEKTPDLSIEKNNIKYYVECKRLSRRTDYAQNEQIAFLKAWKNSENILLREFKNYWFNFEIKTDILNKNVDDFNDILLKVKKKNGYAFYEDEDYKIIGEKKDLNAINNYLSENYVKANSFILSKLLGEDLVYPNCERTHTVHGNTSQMIGAVAPVLGTYVENISFFFGVTRSFSSLISKEKKAREITSHVKEALTQVIKYKPAIIHIMFEAMESDEVEFIRWMKINDKMNNVILKDLDDQTSVKIHRIQHIESIDMMFDMLETTKTWGQEIDSNLFDIIPNGNLL
ncbi:hypothetical protein [Acinetobacter venetianus]|uniref:hypothetical protein n=1 Tax=Acinetobacter venetianus TaxID=52133 RepID=UPI0003779654|nr:hypothetical protein [Acinetobacter venetianus]